MFVLNALGDGELIKTMDGQKLEACPIVVEAVADIAALGALDDQAFDTEPFEKFCEVTPIRLAKVVFPPGRHKAFRGWTCYGRPAMTWREFREWLKWRKGWCVGSEFLTIKLVMLVILLARHLPRNPFGVALLLTFRK